MTQDRTSIAEPGCSADLGAAVVAFASAVKNLTIYPASHPRVEARAAEFAATFAALERSRLDVVLHGDRLAAGGETLPDQPLTLTWLAQRCRETGLRGITIERDCSAEDVLRFATALLACRPGSGQNLAEAWRDDTARVRPIALLVADTHAEGSRRRRGELPPESADPAGPHVDPRSRALLRAVAARPTVQDLVRAIGEDAGGDDDGAAQVDLLDAIGALLPADAPQDPDALADTVEHILQRVQQQVAGIERESARVRGAELLRSAVGVARRYFRQQAPQQRHEDDLPTGRPEDDRYHADVDAMLAEFDALPIDVPPLPPAADTQPNSPAMARELCGIYLHGLTLEPAPAVARALVELIARLATEQAPRLADLLDVYLAPDASTTHLPSAIRAAVVGALAAQGLGSFVRERGYLDEQFVVGAFPDGLHALPALFADEAGLPLLRRALERLEPQLLAGGARAAARGGHLRDAAVVDLLARVGGRGSLLLLSHVESLDPRVHETLCAFAATLPLPEAESVVLQACPCTDLPPAWLHDVLRAAVDGCVPEPLRQRTGELLREMLAVRRSALDLAKGLAAVKALRHVPCRETEHLLRRLASAGRFVNFTHSARLLRARANATLQAIQRSRP